ncbi:hypothetical protein LTS07_008594 [Exophiala sideris]|nr:hypothetical protein LTS07_008594 [Exophiala sideris]KAK5030841.1 hypothetical protein LTR13_008195 [Exophiala sideris]
MLLDEAPIEPLTPEPDNAVVPELLVEELEVEELVAELLTEDVAREAGAREADPVERTAELVEDLEVEELVTERLTEDVAREADPVECTAELVEELEVEELVTELLTEEVAREADPVERTAELGAVPVDAADPPLAVEDELFAVELNGLEVMAEEALPKEVSDVADLEADAIEGADKLSDVMVLWMGRKLLLLE